MKNVMNRFLSSLKMANNLFELYLIKAQDKKLKKLIVESSNIFDKQEQDLSSFINELHYKNDNSLMCGQKWAIMMEKVHLMHIEDDFLLTLRIMESVNMGIRSALKLLHQYKDELNLFFQKKAKEIIEEHEKIIINFKEYASAVI